jgi:hypothetical protein
MEQFLRRMGIGLSEAADSAKNITLSRAIHDTRTFNQLLREANEQLKAGRDSSEIVAKAIGAAVMRGDFRNATKYLTEFARIGQQAVTTNNVYAMIEKVIKSGHPEQVIDIIKEYADASRKATQDMQQYQRDLVQYQRQLSQTITQTTTDTINSLKDFYNQLYQANQEAFGQLMQGPFLGGEAADLAKEWGIEPGLSDITKDLNAQTRIFKERMRDIRLLTRRGIPAAALQGMLAGMSPEDAVSLLRNLMKASPKQIKSFQVAWKNSQTVITRQTRVDFTQRIAQFKRAGVSMAEAIKNGFSQEMLSDRGLSAWIKTHFPGLIQAAVASAVRDFRRTTQRPQRPQFTPRDFANPRRIPGVRVTNDNRVQVTVVDTSGHERTATYNQRRHAFIISRAVKRHHRPRQHTGVPGAPVPPVTLRPPR